jgi:hypothetical protein
MPLYKSLILVSRSLSVPFKYPCSFFLKHLLLSLHIVHNICISLSWIVQPAYSEIQPFIIFCQTVVYAASVCSDWDSLYLRFGYRNIFPTLLIFLLYLISWKLHISSWMYSDWISIHIKRLYCVLTRWQSVPKFWDTVISFGRFYTQYK